VIIPSIDLICDPDYLNQKIINYINNKESINLNKKITYSSYEEFIKTIKLSNNADELKLLHNKVMNEIMQATLISEFKDKDKEANKISENNNIQNSASQQMNMNGMIAFGGSASFYALSGIRSAESTVNLNKITSLDKTTKPDLKSSKYIKQLRYAKLLCERRLANLKTRSDENILPNLNTLATLEERIKNRKV
jgi:hypothetical protein